MTDTIVHLTSDVLPGTRPTIAQGARQALDQLPDTVLREMGLTRDELPFVAVALASRGHETRVRRLRGSTMRGLLGLLGLLGLAGMALAAVSKFADLSRTALARRGRAGGVKPVFATACQPVRKAPPKDAMWI